MKRKLVLYDILPIFAMSFEGFNRTFMELKESSKPRLTAMSAYD